MNIFLVGKQKGFTIVELLVVIIVIGILAFITIVSYNGVSNRAKVASLQSDLSSASTQLKLFQVADANSSYPTANNCPAPGATEICLKSSTGNAYTYTPNNAANPKTFLLRVTNGTLSYQIANDSSPTVASVITCPTGFIVVPGSPTYGTSDFCVMKYEAKADANGDGIGDTNYTTGYNTYPADTRPISASIKLVSSAAGYPVANITQPIAIAAAQNTGFVTGCPTGCHLITEAEWMTIARDVLSVPSNWDNGAGVHEVGAGYIYSGHNDGTPYSALVADASGNDNYYLTGQSSPSNQRRTLTLTNGEVIWDFAGNIWEWTTAHTDGLTAQQPGVVGINYTSWIEWPDVSTLGSFTVNPFPSGLGLTGSETWTSSNGIGPLLSSATDTTMRGFLRGGFWNYSSTAGVLALDLSSAPSNSGGLIGFRVSR